MGKEMEKLKKALVSEPGYQAYVLATGESYLKGFTDLMTYLTSDHTRSGILISTMWSANALSRRISLSKIPSGNLGIIDTVSMTLGSRLPREGDFRFLPTPVALESIIIEIERNLRAPQMKYNFLIIDSLSNLRRKHSENELMDFLLYILNRMMEENVSVVLFDRENQSGSALGEELSSIMDTRFILKKGG